MVWALKKWRQGRGNAFDNVSDKDNWKISEFPLTAVTCIKTPKPVRSKVSAEIFLTIRLMSEMMKIIILITENLIQKWIS